MWPCSLTENISKCAQEFSIRQEVNRAIDHHWSPANLLEPILACYFCILAAYHCIFTIRWNVNYTTCAWTLSDPPDKPLQINILYTQNKVSVLLKVPLQYFYTSIQVMYTHPHTQHTHTLIQSLPHTYSGRQKKKIPFCFCSTVILWCERTSNYGVNSGLCSRLVHWFRT